MSWIWVLTTLYINSCQKPSINQTNQRFLIWFWCVVFFLSRGSCYLAPIQTEHCLYSDAIFLERQKMQLPQILSFEVTIVSPKYSHSTCLTFYLLAFMYNLWLTHLLIYSFVLVFLFQISNILSKLETLLKHPHRFLFWFLRVSCPCSQTTVSTSLFNQCRSRLKL